MLVLSRRPGQAIVIDGGIRVTVVSIQGEKVRLGIEAPRSIHVDREEVLARRREQAACRAATEQPADCLTAAGLVPASGPPG
jgi:carbon storage regulator